jgi:pSer/pThr/pTyr-binding forkhead associated (FHA) protein
MTCRLRYRGQDLWFARGEFLIGRKGTHVVIPHKLVSRRHALLNVGSQEVFIQDLGSVNGVYVNGGRLGREPQVLKDGDRIVIGGEELVVNLSPDVADESRTGQTEITVAGNSLREGLQEDDEALLPTNRIGSLDLLGPIADKALVLGRTADAERLLSEHLLVILREARLGRRVLPGTLEKASSYAVELAQASGKAAWFDYVVGLHEAVAAPLSDRLMVEMQVALAQVDSVDGSQLDRWLAALIALAPKLDADTQRRVQRCEELVELAAKKRQA